jgi:poly-gamma-glutamate synthesis protein (capsule biosynthesis protein)
METLSFDVDSVGESWSLFAVGDCYLEPGVREEVPLFSPGLRDRAADADLSVANVEAPIPEPGAEPVAKTGPTHRSDPEAPERMAESGFDVVTLANNHAIDFGWGSIEHTVAAYEDAGIEVVGVGETHADALDPARVTVGDFEVAVIGCCGHEFGIAREDTPGAAWSGHPTTQQAISEASDAADATVVLPHGGTSRGPIPSPMRRDRLWGFADAGADLVAGHHSHAPQGWESRADGLVFYCLGDCVFDSHPETDPTSWGLAIDVRFEGSTPVEVDLVPTEVVDGVVRRLGEARTPERPVEDHHAFLRRLSEVIREELHPHWQEVAVHRFREKYADRLRSIQGADLAELEAGTSEPTGERLTLLNNIRYGSHRAVITTALAVLTGVELDQRDPSVTATVEELLSWTDG